jgi:hypothetical protein
MLIELAELEDQDELAQRFRAASLAEQTHLEQVRTWMRELMQGEAQVVGGGTRPS